MIRCLAVLLAILAAAPAWAVQVSVRAGEHNGFTRVVLEFDERPDWTAGRVDGGYAVRFPKIENLSADMSRAFDFINRNRLADIRGRDGSNEVAVLLACECYATFGNYRDTLIVIDIRDGVPGENVAYQSPLPPGPSLSPTAVFDLAVTLQAPVAPPLARTENIPTIIAAPPDRERVPRLIEPDMPSAPTVHDAGNLRVASSQDPPDQERINDAVDIVAANIARATTQGLLQVIDPQMKDTREPRPEPEEIANLSVDTAIERAVASAFDEAIASRATGNCISPDDLDLTAWGDESGLARIGPARAEATKEDGTLDPEKMRDLAHAYLYLGFGAEARSVADHTLSSHQPLIRAMADIIDNGATASPVFAEQFGCSPLAGLWRALAGPFQASELPRDLSGLLEAFSAFPLHLRIHLGPILAERLRVAGLPEESRIALNTVIRAGNSTTQQALTSARLELTGTRADAARARLVALTNGTGLTAGEALLELLNDAAARGVDPDPKWVDDAPSLIRALRGTDVASQLASSMLRGAIALDRFDETRRSLTESKLPLNPDDMPALTDALLDAAVERADDARFLRAEIAFPNRIASSDRDVGLNLRLASRLLDLGLFERADLYAGALPPDADAGLLLAKIDLRLGRHEDALAHLDGVTTEAAAVTRAEILATAGRAAEAADAFFAVADEARGRQNAMRAAQWDRLGLQETTTRAENDSNNELLRMITSRRAALEELLTMSAEM
ncbi:hypothetical protein GQ651_09960 [Alphaproteobacteria bacterium GH1-50]|uniref:Tetratricopeptide repeat protein n=1 Tax=Kangsaoukella pontilimi TaxID=2691042 RepID=A0A7C9IS13_9RHOB|nr:hypothetical protein [Kangsaoukella pontilimi]MXQ08166.1 hypothetical protein [Kangsaoukella pontilimi]